MIDYVDPESGNALSLTDAGWASSETGAVIAPLMHGIPRFVDPAENYAENFGYQWKKWHSIRSGLRNQGYNLKSVILERTRFAEFDLHGKSILECGMGGGDDTEVLLDLPFAEVHAFDLSTAVERAAQFLADPRLRIAQASIYAIPYPDCSFDVVYCHRVLQHTPDPAEALRRICAKVKVGGLLFAHAYKRSWRHMSEWRYKYRWLTKRLPWRVIERYVESCGPALHHLNKWVYRHPISRMLAYNFIPFYHLPANGEGGSTGEGSVIELEKQITFDALTPWHDHPMRSADFRRIIESAGFEIVFMTDPPVSPVFCTAVRRCIPGER